MPNYILTIETLDKYAIGASIRSPLIHIHYPVYDQTLSLWVLVAKICEHATVQTFWWLLYHYQDINCDTSMLQNIEVFVLL